MLDKGESVTSIANNLKVGKSTAHHDRRKHRKAIEDLFPHVEDQTLTDCRILKTPRNKLVDDAFWLRFAKERSRGVPVGGPILKEKE